MEVREDEEARGRHPREGVLVQVPARGQGLRREEDGEQPRTRAGAWGLYSVRRRDEHSSAGPCATKSKLQRPAAEEREAGQQRQQ